MVAVLYCKKNQMLLIFKSNLENSGLHIPEQNEVMISAWAFGCR
jgi:hypothetical protein